MLIGFSARREEGSYKIHARYLEAFPNVNHVLILPCTNDEQLFCLCDGFVLTGGWDANPKRYGQENLDSRHVYDDVDELDLAIIEHCVRYQKPLLGICRGIQLINIYFGGTLHQHISYHENGVLHRIQKKQESKWLSLSKEYFVNSYHHQAIDRLGKSLMELMCSEDQIVELLEHETLPILGCQFHPEINKEEILSCKIFTKMIEKVKEYHMLYKTM